MWDKRTHKQRTVVWALLALTILALTGCSQVVTRRSTQTDATSLAKEDGLSLEGVVVSNDTQAGQMVFRDLGSTIENTLYYDVTAVVTDKYGQEITGTEVEVGQIYEVQYAIGSAKIQKMDVPDDVWEYQEVTKYSMDSQENSISVAGKKYQYTDATYVGALGQGITIMELNRQDVLTVRGTGYSVYSIVRTQGHGFIRLSHYDDFIGGMIEVGSGIILPVSKNMLITAREGTYRVMLSNQSMTAVKTVTVKADQDVTVDFSDYKPAAKNVGYVTFKIEPEGSELTINGTIVDYRKPIPLSYGTYQIGVTMNGYSAYSGTLDVEESTSTVTINLIDAQVAVADNTSDPEATTNATPNSDSGTSDTASDTTQVDSDHTITVSAPKGAEVYLNNVYKGLAPCTFTKIIGAQTLTLSQSGYITKSYSVDILDDDEDVTLSFSELVEAAAQATSSPTAE